MKRTLKILLVEDNIYDIELIKHELKRLEYNIIYLLGLNAKEFSSLLKSESPDVIISDYNLPGFSGSEALEIRNKIKSDIPFLLITGSLKDEIAVEFILKGADDYILKTNLTRLRPAVEGAVKKKRLERLRKQTEMKLESSESKFRKFFHNNIVASFLLDESGRMVECNKACLEIIGGYSIQDIKGTGLLNLFSDYPAILEELNKNGYYKNVRTEISKLNGGTVKVLINLYLENFAAENRRIGGTMIDISELVYIKTQLNSSQKKLNLIINKFPVFLYSYNSSGILTAAAGAGFKSTPVGTDLLVGTSIISLFSATPFISGDAAYSINEVVEKTLGGDEVVSIINIGDKYFDNRLIPVPDASGSITEVNGAAFDITDQIKANMRLRESEERYRTLMDHSPLPIWVRKGEEIKYVNKTALQFFGLDDESQIIGRSNLDFIHPDSLEEVKRRIEDMKLGFIVPKKEEKFIRKDGSEIIAEVSAVHFRYYYDDAVLVIAQDVSEQRRAEEKTKLEYSRLVGIIKSSSLLLFIVNSNYSIEFVSGNISEELNRKRLQHKLINETIVAKTSFGDHQNFNQIISSVFNGAQISGKLHLKDESFEVILQPRENEDCISGIILKI